MEPRIQYAKTSDGVSIAYATLGEGPPVVWAVHSHTQSRTRHQRQDTPFPQWVPEPLLIASESLSAREASHEIQVWLDRYSAA